MLEKEQKIYFIGMAAISAIGLLVLLSIFSFEIKRLDKKYTSLLMENIVKIEEQLHKEPIAESFVMEYLENEGYLKQQVSHISNGKLLNWNQWIVTAVLFIIILFLLQSLWGLREMYQIYAKIDKGADLLSEIIGWNNETVKNSAKWEQLRHRCEKSYSHNAIGRLYGEIWETAQIVREREYERKQERNYLKDMMSAISHQLKTPLASLQVFLDIFEKEVSTQSKAKQKNSRHSMKELAAQAKLQMERMHWLVTGILKLAQIESGTLLLDYQMFPVILTMQKSIAALKIKLNEKNQQIELSGDKKILLKQDVNWMQEAFLNILKNASENAPENSSIHVSIEQTSLAVVIAIEDNGSGIPEKELPKIFNRFYRVHSKEHTDGVGIGLALAKSIIEKQGGIISVFSRTGEASYTRFVVTFLTKL